MKLKAPFTLLIGILFFTLSSCSKAIDTEEDLSQSYYFTLQADSNNEQVIQIDVTLTEYNKEGQITKEQQLLNCPINKCQELKSDPSSKFVTIKLSEGREFLYDYTIYDLSKDRNINLNAQTTNLDFYEPIFFISFQDLRSMNKGEETDLYVYQYNNNNEMINFSYFPQIKNNFTIPLFDPEIDHFRITVTSRTKAENKESTSWMDQTFYTNAKVQEILFKDDTSLVDYEPTKNFETYFTISNAFMTEVNIFAVEMDEANNIIKKHEFMNVTGNYSFKTIINNTLTKKVTVAFTTESFVNTHIMYVIPRDFQVSPFENRIIEISPLTITQPLEIK